MYRTALLLSLLPLSFSISAQYTATVKTSVTKTEALGWRKWSNGECSINYPSSWTNEGPLGTDALTSFFAPGDSTGGFRGRVFLRNQNADEIPFAEFARQLEERSREALADGRVTGSTVGDDDASSEFTGLMDDVLVNEKQEAKLQNGKIWILTYTAPRREYEDQLYLVDALFLSLAVK